MSLCHQHYRDELEMQLGHQSSLCDVLERLATSHRNSIMSSLDSIHDRQVQQLKRDMYVGNKDEMKLLAAKYTNKHELARYARRQCVCIVINTALFFHPFFVSLLFHFPMKICTRFSSLETCIKLKL